MKLQAKKSFSGIDISEIRKMNALAEDDTINLGIGQLPDELPDPLKVQGIYAFNNGVTRYTSNQGMPLLREHISKYHSQKYNKKISPDQVVITNGAEGAIWNILYTYLEVGDEVLIPEISFTVYDTITKMQQGRSVSFKMDNNFEPDIEHIKTLITEKTKFLVINSPINPTGSVISQKTIEELAKLADKHGFYIISDEIYSELYFGTDKPSSPYSFTDRVIVVDGISKRSAATGLRIGWTISDLDLVKPMVIANQYIATCASSVSQYTAIKSVDGSNDQFVSNVRDDLKRKSEYAYSILSNIEGLEVVNPQGAFYIFPNISKFGKSKDIAIRILEECDVLVIPGIAFGNKGDDYIRISYAVDFDLLKTALERIKEFFEGFKG